MAEQHQYAPGDSVLVRRDGNQVPGVVAEVEGDRVLVTLAQPYVDETSENQTEVWCQLGEVEPIMDDTAPQELRG